MIKSIIISIAVIVSLMVAWGAIQFMWRRLFSDHLSDPDVLAGRNSCGNCGCTTSCENKTRRINYKD